MIDYDTSTDSVNFLDCAFSIVNKIFTFTDIWSAKNYGIDILSNVEKLTFADQYVLVNS